MMMPAVAAQNLPTAPRASAGRKVLVAEDSPITHELLKLLLKQRGHQVDIATDGRQALEALRTHDYDVALLDFHLPLMDGLQVAAALKKTADGRKLPRLIAITADVEGLLAHKGGCEHFDHIIPKPLDIYQVGKLVEEQADIAEQQAAQTRAAPASPQPIEAAVSRPPSFFEELGYQFIAWPEDLEANRLSARGMQATLGDPRFDGILIREPVSADELVSIWHRKALFALPVIDLTGTLGTKADLDASKLSAQDAEQVSQLIRHFQDRRARLHRDLLLSENMGEKLLGRVFVSERPLAAALDPESKSFISYNTTLSGPLVAREAENLCQQGLFKLEFFDRFQTCPRCQSARMHVREECWKCRSADLVEEPYLHHFKCAYQGPESQFRQGDDLICPKCRRELTHFGFDYDRPGSMIVCQACGHAASDPAVGFVCLDCNTHTDSDACPTSDVYSYQLTDDGLGFAEFGKTFLGQAHEALRFAELPLELIVALNAAAKRYNEEKVPFTLVNIAYEKEREITAEHGARQFAQARDLFIENLRAATHSADMVIKGQSYDYALLSNIDPAQAKKEFNRLRDAAQATVRFDLGARLKAFGPEDFS
jgi:CheY-like chemotaxis protein